MIRSLRHGDALASSFSRQSSEDLKTVPDYSVVLMKGHGFTVATDSIESAVFQAIYTQCNARILSTALQAGSVTSSSTEDRVAYLTEEQGKATWEGNQPTVHRPWALWQTEVTALRQKPDLYRNEFANDSQTGM